MRALVNELAECLRQCRSALETALADAIDDPVRKRVIERRIASADRVLEKVAGQA